MSHIAGQYFTEQFYLSDLHAVGTRTLNLEGGPSVMFEGLGVIERERLRLEPVVVWEKDIPRFDSLIFVNHFPISRLPGRRAVVGAF